MPERVFRASCVRVVQATPAAWARDGVLRWPGCVGRVSALVLAALLLLATPARAAMINLDPHHFGVRDMAVTERGMLQGVILNVSTNTLAGVQATITAYDRQGTQLWQRTISLPTLKPTQRFPVEIQVGLEGGQPASYEVGYVMDDTVGTNPDVITSTERRQVGFSLKGKGDFQSKPFKFSPGTKTVMLEYLGEDMAILTLQNKGMTFEQQLLELQGPGNATATVVIDNEDEYMLHFDCQGSWVVQIKDDTLAGKGPEYTTPGGAPVAGGQAAPAAPAPSAGSRSRQNVLIVE